MLAVRIITEYFLRKGEDKKIQIKKYSKTLTLRNLSVRRVMYDACLIQVPVNRSVIEGLTLVVSNLQNYHMHHNKRIDILVKVSVKPVIPFQNSKLNHYKEAKLGL